MDRLLPEWNAGAQPAAAQLVPPVHRGPAPGRGGGAGRPRSTRSVCAPGPAARRRAGSTTSARGTRVTTPTPASSWSRRSRRGSASRADDIAVLVDARARAPAARVGRDESRPERSGHDRHASRDAVGDRDDARAARRAHEGGLARDGRHACGAAGRKSSIDDLVRAGRTACCAAGPVPSPRSTSPTPRASALVARAAGERAGRGRRARRVVVVAPDRAGPARDDRRAASRCAARACGPRRRRPTTHGVAVDTFTVQPIFDRRPGLGDAPRRPRRRAATATLDLDARGRGAVATATGRRATAARPPDPVVLVHLGAASDSTVVEVRSPDDVGVLFRIARTFTGLGLDIHQARVGDARPGGRRHVLRARRTGAPGRRPRRRDHRRRCMEMLTPAVERRAGSARSVRCSTFDAGPLERAGVVVLLHARLAASVGRRRRRIREAADPLGARRRRRVDARRSGRTRRRRSTGRASRLLPMLFALRSRLVRNQRSPARPGPSGGAPRNRHSRNRRTDVWS